MSTLSQKYLFKPLGAAAVVCLLFSPFFDKWHSILKKDNGMIVEGFICLQYFEMYLYKFGKMTDKNKENRFTIKTRIFNCKHLKKN